MVSPAAAAVNRIILRLIGLPLGLNSVVDGFLRKGCANRDFQGPTVVNGLYSSGLM